MTARAVLIGTGVTVLIAVATPYSDLVMRGTWVGLTAFPISSFFVLVALALGLNPLLRRLGKTLSTRELLTVFCMALVAAGIPSFGLTGLLIPYMAGPRYFASPENQWDEVLLPHLPSCLAPRDDSAIVALYEGTSATGVPWAVWLGPLLSWTVLAAALYLCIFCLCSLLRRPWVDDEKLVFPLTQLPGDLAEVDSGRTFPPLFRNPVMWGFAAVPLLIHTLNGLHFYFPAIPSIPVHRLDLGIYLRERPWTAMSPLWMRFSFTAIGVSYLLPAELSFSLWFFFLFFLAQQVIGSALGYTMPKVQAYPVRQFVAHQMVGGILWFGVFLLWNARSRLKAALDTARRRDWSQPPGEAMGHGKAFAGLALGMGIICAWGELAGAGVTATLVMFLLFFVVHLVAVRLVCEGGMLYVQHPFRPMNMILAATGSARLGAQRIATLNLFDHLFMLDNRSPLMPCLMQSLKLSDRAGTPRRQLTLALAWSVGLAAICSYVAYLRLMYAHGGLSLNPWFTTYYTRSLYSSWTANLITHGQAASPVTFVTMAVGAATVVFLLAMHRNFLWWPLHPIGYLMGASWPMINFWFPILLGWAAKSLIMRYGGARAYRYLIAGFVGFIFAEFTSAGVWVVVDFFAGVRGHEIFSF
jgi:hypothetical protein